MVEYLAWDFPGGIIGIAILVLLLLVAVVISYRWTLTGLSYWKRVILILLRFCWCLLLVFCLCNPRQVREETSKQTFTQKVAIVMDVSSSMRKTCFSGKSRFEESVEYFNKYLKPTLENYETSFWVFSEKLQKVQSFDDITPSCSDILNTRLYSSVCQWNNTLTADGNNAVVCFSDGVDTTNENITQAIASIQTSSLRQAFVISPAAQAGAPYLKLARVESPTIADVGSKIPVNLLVDYSGLASGQKLKIFVSEGQRTLAQKNYSTQPSASGSWAEQLDIEIDKPGTHKYTAVLESSGKTISTCTWSVQAHNRRQTRMLLYQGGLDWGTRFLRGASGNSDNDFSLDVRFTPDALGSHSRLNSLQNQFPAENELRNYDVVVILKMKRKQLTPQIEKRLQAFVEKGGALLFIVANSLDAQEYATSTMEKFLPVVFEHLGTKKDQLTISFLKQMARYRTPRKIPLNRDRLDPNRDYSIKVPPLSTMKLTPDGKRSSIFRYLNKASDYCLPAFQDFALITHSKPAATVLAIHPKLSTGGKPRILLAEQQYGLGRSAVLATDPLWRWRLSLPSSNNSYYMFWKHLINWLSCRSKSQPYFTIPNCLVDLPCSITINFDIPYTSMIDIKDLSLSVVSSDRASRKSLAFVPRPDYYRGYSATFSPSHPGIYNFEAKNIKGVIAQACLTIQNPHVEKELMLTKPDLKSIKRLGSCHNSTFVSNPKSFLWKDWLPKNRTIEKRISSELFFWHDWRIFLLITLILIIDFITRRVFRLV